MEFTDEPLFPMPLMDYSLMGHAPPKSTRPLPTWLDVAKRQYVNGQLTLAEFEHSVELLFKAGVAEHPAPPPHPVHGYQFGKVGS